MYVSGYKSNLSQCQDKVRHSKIVNLLFNTNNYTPRRQKEDEFQNDSHLKSIGPDYHPNGQNSLEHFLSIFVESIQERLFVVSKA